MAFRKLICGMVISVVVFSAPASILATQPEDEFAKEMMEGMMQGMTEMFAAAIPDVRETIDFEKGMQGKTQIESIVDASFADLYADVWGEDTFYPNSLNPHTKKTIKGEKLYCTETVSFSDVTQLSGGSWGRKFSYASDKKWFSEEFHISVVFGAGEEDQGDEATDQEFTEMLRAMSVGHFYTFEITTRGEIEGAKPIQVKDIEIEPIVDKQKASWKIPVGMILSGDLEFTIQATIKE